MFPALFLALLVGQIDGPRTRASALAGGLIALALTPVLPPGLPIVAATLGAAIALTVRRREPRVTAADAEASVTAADREAHVTAADPEAGS
jgi:predicted branched-subunit amino acid permease